MIALTPRIERWSNEKLDKEIMFAELAVDDCDTRTLDWLNSLYDEQQARYREPAK